MFKKAHPTVGARPGTLIVSENYPPPRLRVTRYTVDSHHEEVVNTEHVESLGDVLRSDSVTWIDIQGLGDAMILQRVAEIFHIHPLAMEDIVNVPQRPKAELYDEQQLIICRSVSMPGVLQLKMEQVSVVLGPNYVITFQQRHSELLNVVRFRLRRENARLRRSGADYLAYAIIDTVMDECYPILESLGDQIEQLEDLVLEKPHPALLRRLNSIKNQLVNLRRSIWPQREALYSLVHDENDLIGDKVRMFLRDTHDHCVQTSEVVEMYREMVTGLFNTYLSSIGHRSNEVMKTLTIMASVFIPLTFIAGVYGMNFEHMPELQISWAYPLVWLTMLGTVGAMLLYFHRKGWIGIRRSDDLHVGGGPFEPRNSGVTSATVLDHDQHTPHGKPQPLRRAS